MLCYGLETAYNLSSLLKLTLIGIELSDNDINLILKSLSNSFIKRLNYLGLGDKKREDWSLLLEHIKKNNLQNLEVLELYTLTEETVINITELVKYGYLPFLTLVKGITKTRECGRLLRNLNDNLQYRKRVLIYDINRF